MTGTWEQRLDKLAHGGRDWALPSHSELTTNLQALSDSLSRAASEPGIVGAAGTAATESLDDAAHRALAIVEAANAVNRAAEKANTVRWRAQADLDDLPAGELDWNERLLIGAAAVGSTIYLGPFALLAGASAIANGDRTKAAMREAKAREAVRRAGEDFADIELPTTIDVDGGASVGGSSGNVRPSQTGGTSGGIGVGSAGRGTPGGGFSGYPDFDIDPIQVVARDPGIRIVTPGTPIPPGSTFIPTDPGPWPQGPTPGGSPGLVGADGSSIGAVQVGSGGLLGGADPLSSGVGSAVGSAAVLGAGATLARGAAGRVAFGAGAFGSVKGAPAPGGLAGSTAPAAGAAGRTPQQAGPRGSGGLLGSAAGRQGAGASGGRSGARAGVRGASGTRGAGAGAGAGTEGARGAGTGAATSRAVAGAGSPGGRKDSKRRTRGRGLAGAIAPSLEDDLEIGPRSEAAMAGERGVEPDIADATPSDE